MKTSKVGVLGAGAWGTAVAQALARGGHDVVIWAMEQDVTDSINNCHENKRYLPGFTLSKELRASTDIEEVASDREFLILGSPSLYLASTIKKILHVPSIADGSTCIGVLTKGFVPSDDGPRLILETLEQVLPPSYRGNLVYVAGPSHAEEVAMGKLTGLIAASENPKNSIRFRELLRVPGLMVYSSLDVVGVQICAAAKNVIAVVYGSLDAIAENSTLFGDNTESLLLAAGLNEIQTLGFAMGATHAETFTSISGVGDLDVTCRSKFGRNRRFGHDIINTDILTKFKDLDDLIAHIGEIGYLPEGAVACKYVHAIAEKHNLKLPICNALYRILNKEIEPEDVMLELLSF
ncbi:MAG: NAD(P)-dependent glycerol-3-phosphate dehydrogenase [Candidatus Treponema excrementipullorum]|nr:NAD(P)-dependent glycerol-3-phosphate dehydrogenase [Spirochaetia bacterium]MDD7011725.1 NAD(P)-dependent glycerol-3-phosphate dehydrogenase [Candidatus Treponema excrementipullorum]MDY2754845.1 NAD(P)H-dependent glycerol-3-phosphate dehydrogenase [Candidatus Treponema excrementipullorum]MDY4707922.1 NAD(P)H-dependent glycerol-3-phosphate dehydrogenase [Candidatus Treponema excrementipullorum]